MQLSTDWSEEKLADHLEENFLKIEGEIVTALGQGGVYSVAPGYPSYIQNSTEVRQRCVKGLMPQGQRIEDSSEAIVQVTRSL